jgi:hypothetical protein
VAEKLRSPHLGDMSLLFPLDGGLAGLSSVGNDVSPSCKTIYFSKEEKFIFDRLRLPCTMAFWDLSLYLENFAEFLKSHTYAEIVYNCPLVLMDRITEASYNFPYSQNPDSSLGWYRSFSDSRAHLCRLLSGFSSTLQNYFADLPGISEKYGRIIRMFDASGTNAPNVSYFAAGSLLKDKTPGNYVCSCEFDHELSLDLAAFPVREACEENFLSWDEAVGSGAIVPAGGVNSLMNCPLMDESVNRLEGTWKNSGGRVFYEGPRDMPVVLFQPDN